VEIEFSVNLSSDKKKKSDFFFLQMRPMVAGGERFEVQITRQEIEKAFCRSKKALGNGKNEEMADIVYVKPDDFQLGATIRMAEEIDRLNAGLVKGNGAIFQV
ncbi:MAG: hypothetical protein JRC89_14255, partial [Deltaproteobacteria bacterium]|nr:hypothetical protein [Deltaproteobacteria bacterium]